MPNGVLWPCISCLPGNTTGYTCTTPVPRPDEVTGAVFPPPSRGDARAALVDPVTRQFRSSVPRNDLMLSLIPHLLGSLGRQPSNIAIATLAQLTFLKVGYPFNVGPQLPYEHSLIVSSQAESAKFTLAAKSTPAGAQDPLPKIFWIQLSSSPCRVSRASANSLRRIALDFWQM